MRASNNNRGSGDRSAAVRWKMGKVADLVLLRDSETAKEVIDLATKYANAPLLHKIGAAEVAGLYVLRSYTESTKRPISGAELKVLNLIMFSRMFPKSIG